MGRSIKLITSILVIISFIYSSKIYAQGCDLDVNAGPDLFTCDPSEVLQLKGSINYNFAPMLIEWSPTTGLSDPNIVDPMVTLPPGRYKYKLKAESVSDNLIVNGDFEAGNVGFTSEMTYTNTPTGNLPMGYYTVTDVPRDYETLFHCSASGNVLLGEASATPGLGVWCQTVPTKVGGTYFFSFRMTKANKFGAPMHFKAEANGVLLGESAYVPVCTWIEFRTCFVATSSSTKLCIRDSRGSRSTFAIDDIVLIQKCKDEDEVEIEVVDLKAKLRAFPEPTCNSQIFTVDATGSIMPKSPNIKFTWTASNGGTILQNLGSVIKVKGAGTYKVHLLYTSNLGKCEDETEIEIETQDQLEGQLEVRGKPTCNKDTFDLTGFVLQGTGSYSYNWTPASNIIAGQGTPFARAVNPGKYILKIIDKNTGCEFETSVKVEGDGTLPSGEIKGDSLIDCNNPSVFLNSTETDTAKFFLKWITPDQKQIDDVINLQINKPGDVKLVITDKISKCRDTAYWHVDENVNYPKIDLGNDLVIDCKVEEHNVLPTQEFQVGKFKYIWTLPGGNKITEDGLYDKKITQAGKVVIQVLNEDNNCSTSDSIDVLDLRSNPSVKVNTPGPVNCSFLNVRVSSNVTAKNAKINWYTVNGNINSGSSTSSITVDKGGRYYIEVEDTIGHCYYLDSVDVTEDKKSPIVDLKTDTIFRCKDSQKIIDASGSSNYDHLKYVWNGSGIIDAGQGTNLLTVSSAGNFRLTIIDTTNGCSDTKQVTIVPDRNTPLATIVAPNILTCAVTSVQLDAKVNSSTGNPMIYSWRSLQNNPITNSSTLTPTITRPGDYEIEVTDSVNGCKTFSVVKVDIDTVSPPLDLGSDLIWNCKTTDLTLDVKNNTQGLKLLYEWSTSNGIILNSTNQPSITAGAAGTYSLKITDTKNGCSTIKDIRINLDKNIPIAEAATPDLLTCIVRSATLDSKGSSIGANIVYTWKDINGQMIGNQNTIKVNAKGFYILEVLDLNNNCLKLDTVEVQENVIQPQLSINQPSQLNCKTLDIILQGKISIPQNNYSIQWSTINGSIVNGSNTLNPKVNLEGTYVMTVTDLNNGCTNSEIINVTRDNNIPTGLVTNVNQPKCVDDPGIINVLSVTGGKPNYQYYLNGVLISNEKNIEVATGKHTIKVIDNNGCEFSQDIEIFEPIPLSVDLKPEVTIIRGNPYELTPKFNIPESDIDSYEWSPEEYLDCNNCPNPKIKNLSNDQVFTVTITDKNGCTATATIRIRLEDRGIWVPNVFNPSSSINGTFYPIVKEDSYREIRYMKIFDRWGEMVWTNEHFQPNTPVNGWQGVFRNEYSVPGVYAWVLEVEWKNGETERLYGDVTLLR